ncbi:hypothetical protein PMAYCL1PPCAC_06748 [Pristionchus mayeri]|uniref:C3H1-type domain-containing protein n=1 Tax=Pristionchus mayeri TaxID=1317129 RepID=A0AAN4ZDK2_9BILA|nr:hypothetical protein PMAYCL1PPCAC_06748 [Pristionchus mayeri]
MGDNAELLEELQEKEDGELDSDIEEDSANIAPVSPNLLEDAIDKLLASCNETCGDVDDRISLKSLASDRMSRNERDIPSTYRRRSNDANDNRPSRIEKKTRSKDNHRSSPPNRPKSRRRKQKQRSRNNSKDNFPTNPDGVDREWKGGNVEMAVEVEGMENTRVEKENAEKLEKSPMNAPSKEKVLSDLDKRREKLEENAKSIDEKKSRLVKSERSLMIKKGYISDMCKRRDDYVARVRRLIEDIECHVKEEKEMIREAEELRKEVIEEEMHWKMDCNQLESDAFTEMLRPAENDKDASMAEVEEVVSDGREEEQEEEDGDETIDGEKEGEGTKSTWMEDHDEDTLRNILLMQLQSKEQSAGAEAVNGEKPSGEGTPVEESGGEEMEQEEVEMEDEHGDIPMGIVGDEGSTMCPWDLNGICKDDECPFVHNRLSSRLEYSQEIAT